MLEDRTFVACFAISLFLHLTMVTLFSIELRYEQKPIRYYPIDIVDVRQIELPAPQAVAKLDLPPEATPSFPDNPTDRTEYLASLPKIALPTLAFDEIPTVSLREPSYESARLNSPLTNPQDAWARFGEEIQGVRDVLRSLAPFDLLPAPQGRKDEASEPFSPAPGLRGRVEWMADPRDRKLLYAPPPSPQWGAARAGLDRAVSVMFQVKPNGSVGQIIAPVEEHGELIDGVVEALKGYRFEPQPRGAGSQPASLIVEPEESAP